MKFVIPCLCAVSILAGCATKSENIAAAYVSPMQYQDYSCKQIAAEASRLSARSAQAAGVQDQRASGDSARMAVGLVVFWPVLLFNKGDGAEATEVARLKGEMQALEQVSIAKNCGIVFQAPPKAVAKPAAPEAPTGTSFSAKG